MKNSLKIFKKNFKMLKYWKNIILRRCMRKRKSWNNCCGGWQMGPRYITAMLPFLVPLPRWNDLAGH